MRKYQKIWELIKDNKHCYVEVHSLIASRVVKAVIKEKDGDVGFKLANPLDKPYLAIERITLARKELVRLEFRLKQRYGLVPLQRPEVVQLQPEEIDL
jgi:hypothetical protein